MTFKIGSSSPDLIECFSFLFFKLISICIHRLASELFMPIFYILQFFFCFFFFFFFFRGGVCGGGCLSDHENRVKVTELFFQGHWNIKVTATESPCTLVLHLSLFRYHGLVHFTECRQDAIPTMPEGSAYKTTFSPYPLFDGRNFHIQWRLNLRLHKVHLMCTWGARHL